MELTLEKNFVELGLELNLNSVEKRLDTRHFKEPLKHLLKVKLSKNALKIFEDAYPVIMGKQIEKISFYLVASF